MRRALLPFIWLLYVVASVNQAFADTRIPRTIDQAIAWADAVVSATVSSASPIEIDGERCGTQYALRVGRIFKSDRQLSLTIRQDLKIGRFEELDVNREYLLFLKWIDNPDDEYERLVAGQLRRPDFPTAKDLVLARCGNLVPGYMFEEAWPVGEQSVSVFALWPRSAIPAEIHVDSVFGPRWMLRKIDVFRYLDNNVRAATPQNR